MDSITAFWQQSSGANLSSFYSINHIQTFSGQCSSSSPINLNLPGDSSAFLVSIFSAAFYIPSSASARNVGLATFPFEFLLTVQTSMINITIPTVVTSSSATDSAVSLVLVTSTTSNAVNFAWGGATGTTFNRVQISGYVACLS